MNAVSQEKDYVQPSSHDMRRTKQVNADMAKKLVKQEEENKEEKKRRPSEAGARAGMRSNK